MTFDPNSRNPSASPFPEINLDPGALSLEDWDKPAAKKPEPVARIPVPPSPAATTATTGPSELTGHDISRLNPKEFRNANLGLEIYAPGSWKEVKNSRSLHLLDSITGTKLEANGLARADTPIEKWVGMRLHIVDKEMPYMKQVAKPSIIKGENWSNRIQGIVAEYKGMQTGDEEESHMLICCMRTDDMLVSIAITAKASVFAANRAVYNWIFSRTDLGMAMATVSGSASSANSSSGSGKRTASGSNSGSSSGSSGGRSSATSSVQFAHNDSNGGDYYVGRLAIGQRLLILAILLNIGLTAWVKSVDYGSRAQLLLACAGLLMIVLMSVVGFFRLAGGFGWSGGRTVLMLLLSCIPLLGLIMMVIYNIKATARIKDEGYTVGLLGAKDAIPDDNHDLRNIILISLVLTACLYAVSGKFIKAPKEDPIAEFSPPDHRYSISMPGTPTEQKLPKEPGVFNNHTYTLRAGKMQYAITSFDLEARPADTTFFLDALKEGVVSQGKGRINVTDEKTIRIEGNTGRSLMMTDYKSVKQVNFFLAGKTVYIIEADAPMNEKNSPKIQAFFDSFHLN